MSLLDKLLQEPAVSEVPRLHSALLAKERDEACAKRGCYIWRGSLKKRIHGTSNDSGRL